LLIRDGKTRGRKPLPLEMHPPIVPNHVFMGRLVNRRGGILPRICMVTSTLPISIALPIILTRGVAPISLVRTTPSPITPVSRRRVSFLNRF
jgi:hypothetical protein